MGPEAKAAIRALAELLRDRDGYVAIDASHTLGRMGLEAVPSLAELLRDENPRVRELAVRTLRQIGSEAALGGPKEPVEAL
jgi:HEAT repeat protein